MLRRLQTIDGKNIDVMCTANANMVRGMVVQKDLANKKVILPTDSTNLYFVDRDVQPTGLIAYEGEISDYDERLDKIKIGDFVQLEKMIAGERYATDQIASGLVVGNYLKADTDGILKKLDSGVSNLVYGGVYNDNGKTLGIVQVNEETLDLAGIEATTSTAITTAVADTTATTEAAIAAAGALVLAEIAVAKAEGSKTQTDVDAAQVLVTALPDGDDKTALQARITAIVVA